MATLNSNVRPLITSSWAKNVKHLRDFLKVLVVFCLLGTPIGITLSWVGIGTISSMAVGEDPMQGSLVGLGGAPLVVLFGFPIGALLAALNSIVFWLLSKALKLNAAFTGFLSGIIPLSVLYVATYITDVLIAGRERDWQTAPILGCVFLASGATGALMGPLAKKWESKLR